MVTKYADFPMLYVTKKCFKTMRIENSDFKGYVSQIHIIEAHQPKKDEIERADSGFKWLQFHADEADVAMTAFYDKNNNIVQWYFDVVNKMKFEKDLPCFEDLYLDIVLTLDGNTELLDEDELQDALSSGDITEEQYEKAYRVSKDLISKISDNQEKIKVFSDKYFEIINSIYTVTDEDIGEKSEKIETFEKERRGARGIVLNDDGKIAVFNIALKNEYKLPGGGIDPGESTTEAFKREIYEETGCEVEIVDFLGTIEELKTKDSFRQVSYIYIAKVINDTKSLHVTEQEEKEGANLTWEKPEKALELITDCFDKLVASPCENKETSVYYTKFIVMRDRKILENYLQKDNN